MKDRRAHILVIRPHEHYIIGDSHSLVVVLLNFFIYATMSKGETAQREITYTASRPGG